MTAITPVDVDSAIEEGQADRQLAVQAARLTHVWPRGFELRHEGLFVKTGSDVDAAERVSDMFVVLGTARDGAGEGHCLVLGWVDEKGRQRRLPVPATAVQRGGADLAGLLASVGIRCVPGKPAHDRLARFLGVIKPTKWIHTVARSGWHTIESATVYVRPNGEVFGEAGEKVMFRSGDSPAANEAAAAICGANGSLEDWQQKVARYGVGNDRLAFSICGGFTGPLLELAGEQTAGANIYGDSQTGKTTVLQCAASVWGPGKRGGQVRQWRATDNGLEAMAAQTSGGLLPLDEMGQAAASTVADSVYGIFNESGKSRMTRTGGYKVPATWSLFVLSTGEKTLAQKMAEAGKTITAGLEVRLAEIPADAGAGYGIFQDLHGFPSAGELADHLRGAAARWYGTAGPTFMRELMERLADPAMAERVRAGAAKWRQDFITRYVPDGAAGQVRSVAGRFGLVALAGKIATEMGVLPWPLDEAERAVVACFRAWLDARGGKGPAEDDKAIAQVRHFLERNGSSQFEEITQPEKNGGYIVAANGKTLNRVGYWRWEKGEEGDQVKQDPVKQFLFFPEVWKADVCKGFSPSRVAKMLHAMGYLERGEGKHWGKKVTVDGVSKRMIHISARLIGDD